MKRLLLILPLFLAVSCGKSLSDEEQGQQMLREARQAYSRKDYAAARDTILSLRQRFPMALAARREAILLLDSVELMDAQDDSLKAEFFRRKLQHDLEGLESRE